MTDVMDRLKTETWDLHQKAEQQDFQKRMVSGQISRLDYASWLNQMLHIHRSLEAQLRSRSADPRFAAVHPEQYQQPYLESDLALLGAPVSPPLPATQRLIKQIETAAEQGPVAILGYHYVLEGSNNGNRFIAKRLLPALGIAAGTADRYLDPYGEKQRELWARFKQEMREIDFSPAEGDTLVEAAREMFAGIADLSKELHEVTATVTV